MALVSCAECGGKVSSSAAACPHCGHPLTPGATPRAVSSSAAKGEDERRAAPGPSLFSAGALPEQEKVLWRGRPSLKVLAIDASLGALFSVLLIVGTVLTLPAALRTIAGFSKDFAKTVAEGEGTLRTVVWVVVAVTILFRLGRLAFRALSLRGRRYQLTSQRLTVETGIVGRRLMELDMRAVEDVALSQSLTERLLGVGTIELTASDAPLADMSPGGVGGGVARGKGRLTMVGIASPREVREAIRGAAYQATRNQLFTRST